MEQPTATALSESALSEVATARESIPLDQREDLTVDELERMSLPFPVEIYNGRAVVKMANLEHGIIQANLITQFGLYLKNNPVGHVATDTNFSLWSNRPKESRIPDVCFISKDRLPQNLRRFPRMAPDLAVEVLSPDDSVEKVLEKVDEYLQQGTLVVWLVIPKTREVLVCTAEMKISVRDVLTAPELLPDFKLPVNEIFSGLES